MKPLLQMLFHRGSGSKKRPQRSTPRPGSGTAPKRRSESRVVIDLTSSIGPRASEGIAKRVAKAAARHKGEKAAVFLIS